MPDMQTLKEIANQQANKQDGMVDALTNKSPILAQARWMEASHGLWNTAEEVADIQGAGFVEMNSPLPSAGVTTNLRRVELAIMGARIEVPEDTADQFGGAGNYFAKRQDKVLRKTGNDTEKTLYYDNWLRYALENPGQAVNAGATAGGVSSIVVLRFDEDGCTGLYDKSQFAKGTLLNATPINGGNLYDLKDARFPGVLGYGVRLLGRFGWQLLDPTCVSAVVNIHPNTLPTAAMIDDAIALAHGDPADTLILCHARTAGMAINPIKPNTVIKSGDREVDTIVDHWNRIPIVTSYNLKHLAETVAAPA